LLLQCGLGLVANSQISIEGAPVTSNRERQLLVRSAVMDAE
jgi:hypothetical protein